jgi:phenylpropionate dioxygenase-like ring-hydroxylating dioxygenase large terminal subunit
MAIVARASILQEVSPRRTTRGLWFCRDDPGCRKAFSGPEFPLVTVAPASPVTPLRVDRFPTPVDEIRSAILEAAALPLHKAVTLPAEAYVDPGYFAHEVENVLKAGWLAVAHVSQLPHPGDYLNLDLLSEPLAVVHGKDGDIRVLSRVCPHRAMDIMPAEFGYAERGNRRILVCPYHRWTFELDGQVKGCPEMHKAEGFNKRDYRLAEFRSEVWNGWVFVNFSGDAPPVAEQYAGIGKVIEPWNPAEMKIAIELSWDCAFNWKVMVENWIESYHHLGIHYQTLNPMMPAQDTWTESQNPYYVHCHLPYKPSLADEVKQKDDAGEHLPGFLKVPGLSIEDQTQWHLFLGLPTFMMLTMRDRVLWYRLQPESESRCKLLTTTLVRKENFDHPDFEKWLESEAKMLSDFHMEDMQVNTAVQRGYSSSRYAPGRLSHLEEPVWHIQRWLAARLQGSYPQRNANG